MKSVDVSVTDGPPPYSKKWLLDDHQTNYGGDYGSISDEKCMQSEKPKYNGNLLLLLMATISLALLSACMCILVWFNYTTAIGSNYTNASLSAVIAENMTVKVQTLQLSKVSSMVVSEVVSYGDYAHTGYAVIVPNDKLKENRVIGSTNFTGTTLDRIPIVNVPYIYLLKLSTLEFKICIGNAPSTTTNTLYIFDNGDQYNAYVLSEIVTSAVLKQDITIGGENESVCNSFNFTAQEDSYYFAVLMAPCDNIEISYTLTADERVLNIHEYLQDYPACLLQPDRDCNFDNITGSQNISLLVFMEPNYDFNSRLTHVKVIVTTHNANSATEIIVVNGSIVIMVIIMAAIAAGVWLLSMRRRSKQINH